MLCALRTREHWYLGLCWFERLPPSKCEVPRNAAAVHTTHVYIIRTAVRSINIDRMI